MNQHGRTIKVFVSSTVVELSKEREAIREAVEKLPLARPVLVEEMGAVAKPIFEVMREQVAEADIFVVILGQEFSEAVRFEYAVARALGKPIFVFVKETVQRGDLLKEFLTELLRTSVIKRFKTPAELSRYATAAIANYLVDTSRRFDLVPSDLKASPYKDELEARLAKRRRDKTLCFVIMPIGKPGTREHAMSKAIFESLIKPAVELESDGNPTGLRCERADQEIRTGNIPRDIVEKLTAAEIVIADLTTRNANVFYELGVRHSLRQKTIMIAQSVRDIPFDISNYRTVIYDPTVGLVDDSIEKLRLTVKALAGVDDIKDSPVLDWI